MTYIIFVLSTIAILQSMAIYVLVKNMIVTLEYEVVEGDKDEFINQANKDDI